MPCAGMYSEVTRMWEEEVNINGALGKYEQGEGIRKGKTFLLLLVN